MFSLIKTVQESKNESLSDQQHIELIIDAQKQQLKKPTRSVVNGESSFVRQRLIDAGHSKTASLYWSWVTGNKRLITDEDVIRLQKQLEAIDQKSSMPDWGRAGT